MKFSAVPIIAAGNLKPFFDAQKRIDSFFLDIFSCSVDGVQRPNKTGQAICQAVLTNKVVSSAIKMQSLLYCDLIDSNLEIQS